MRPPQTVAGRAPRRWRPAATALLFAGVVIGARGWLAWPDVRRLVDANPTTTAFIQRETEVRGGGAKVAWLWVPLEEISPHLIRAVLVGEDIDFFSHHGFAWGEIRVAAAQALREGTRTRGASTIPQQLAKNLWLSSDRSVVRKVKEAALTVQLEEDLTKRRILELYLNVVMFGPGVFGAQAAARAYFDRDALMLTERQGAMLAAALSRPSLWNPGLVSDEYLQRVALIERRMAVAEFLWRHILGQ
ncbi:MAG TPA: monofunctional biosynthetic peptidoglycan transglycosylase [Gemmatimonadales bacterium]